MGPFSKSELLQGESTSLRRHPDFSLKRLRRSLPVNIEGIEVHVPSIYDLILNKRTSGRIKDLADAEALEFIKSSEQQDAD